MDLNAFEIGQTYQLRTFPYNTHTRSGWVGGKTLIRAVLAPASHDNTTVFDGESVQKPLDQEVAKWQSFLRVRDPNTGKVHLMHPGTIENARVYQPDTNSA